MSPPAKPVLPVLTTRTRHYGKTFQYPTLTKRQRFTPYLSQINVAPHPPVSPVIPGGITAIVKSIFSGFSINVTPTVVEPLQPLAPPAPLTPPAPLAPPAPPVSSAVVGGGPPPAHLLLEEDDGLIPKPAGEVGRKVQGRGYNLGRALKWPTEEFNDLRTLVHKLADQHLNLSEGYKNQNHHALLAISDAAIDTFPRLKQYRQNWPVSDLIKLHLKNTLCKLRRARRETTSRAKATRRRPS